MKIRVRSNAMRIRSKVWRYPEFGGWHFFTIGARASAEIRAAVKERPKAFGSIRVKARVGKAEWTTSVFPTKEGTYLLPIKAAIRAQASIEEGDEVTVQLTLL